MTFSEIVNVVNGFAWGPWMLLLLVGTVVYLSRSRSKPTM